ncbi:MAG: hypothetical protein AAB647_00625 [Patescibacteria group bacterium]
MIRRGFIFVSAMTLVFVSMWLTAILQSHAEMQASNDCAIQVGAADCAGTPEHTLHVLAYQINNLGLSGTTVPINQLSLLKLLTVLGAIGGLMYFVKQPEIAQILRRAIRFRRLLGHTTEQRFRTWRVTIQELYPEFAH